jgi:hypothetical protein
LAGSAIARTTTRAMTTLEAEQQLIRPAWEPVSDEPAHLWIQENVELPPDSELKQFDFELFPLAVFVLTELCHNEYLRRFTEMLSAQVGKTVTMLAYLCWKIKNRPGSVGWYTDTNINAKGDYKTKVLPGLEACPSVLALLPSDRAKKNNTLIQFGFMNLRVMGAETRSNREGKTVSEVLCDEVRNYPPGAMQQIDNRYKTITNYRRILFSSAGDMMNEPWLSYFKGTRHQGFWVCPHCQHKQTFRFGRKESPLYPSPRECGGFIWDDNDVTHPSENVYNLPELIKTVRYQCENKACKHEFRESEKTALIRSVKFEQTNLMADPRVDVSVHCWEAYMPFAGCSWGSIVSKFLNAVVDERQGNIEPMRVFVCETLGEPWEDRATKADDSELAKRCGAYSVGEEWPPERHCAGILSVDMQFGYCHVLYRLHTKLGESRLVDRQKLTDLKEVRLYQLAKTRKDGTPFIKDRAVGVDVAHKPREVYAACLEHGRWVQDPKGGRDHIWNGWLPLLGDDAKEFTRVIQDKSGAQHSVKGGWKEVLVNAKQGLSGRDTPIHRFHWSNDHYRKELFWVLIPGKGQLWEIPTNIDPEYFKQIQAVVWRDITDAEGRKIGIEFAEKGRHDDADTELMQRVIADINGICR